MSYNAPLQDKKGINKGHYGISTNYERLAIPFKEGIATLQDAQLYLINQYELGEQPVAVHLDLGAQQFTEPWQYSASKQSCYRHLYTCFPVLLQLQSGPHKLDKDTHLQGNLRYKPVIISNDIQHTLEASVQYDQPCLGHKLIVKVEGGYCINPRTSSQRGEFHYAPRQLSHFYSRNLFGYEGKAIHASDNSQLGGNKFLTIDLQFPIPWHYALPVNPSVPQQTFPFGKDATLKATFIPFIQMAYLGKAAGSIGIEIKIMSFFTCTLGYDIIQRSFFGSSSFALSNRST